MHILYIICGQQYYILLHHVLHVGKLGSTVSDEAKKDNTLVVDRPPVLLV